ncbi:MAG: hypothetical protein LUQ64_02410, partial [Methanomicrobiales archaeon]|nr:hypothetical protein [Methanomicrobiales archaeon]
MAMAVEPGQRQGVAMAGEPGHRQGVAMAGEPGHRREASLMQAVTTIIFLWEAAFTERDHRRMGIDTLTRAGFRTEIWNL